jgi:CubicO group peptidase (beta-lactamase class C family)
LNTSIRATVVLAVALHAASAATIETATAEQDTRFAPAFAEVEQWIEEKAFPGAVLAIGQHGRLIALKAFGHTGYDEGCPPMTTDELFDLASVTKVISTTSAAAYLYERHKLDLDAPVVKYVPEFGGTADHERVTIRQLLTHSSGIPTPGAMYRKATDKPGILRQIYTVPLAAPPGTQFVYRDLNFILLGDVVERVSRKPLDRLVAKHVFRRLGMTSTRYNPPPEWTAHAAPTEMDNILRHRMVRGEVHDENCYMMGGVCGQAGLFSTAGDLAIYAQMLLNGGRYGHKRIFRKSTVELFTRRQDLPPGSSRALGWDTPAPGSFAGILASAHAILHTGFTGTSVYVDFERDAFIILLTNRVHPTRNSDKITPARFAIHTAVLQVLQ